MDFALILLVLTVLTGGIWALDVLVFRPRRVAAAGGDDVKEPVVVDYARSFFPVILLVLVVRSFLYEPFRIPSKSMMPTLLVGDFIFVNKFTYGVRLPVFNSKVVDLGGPERGDVVVFRVIDPRVEERGQFGCYLDKLTGKGRHYGGQPCTPTNYIKRVVGLPGDVVSYRNRQLMINGEPVNLTPAGAYEEHGYRGAQLWSEELGGVEHNVIHSPIGSLGGEYEVPPGHFFMMGDNRDHSKDSRYPQVGFIPEDRLVGRAVRIWMNWDWTSSTVGWSRIGDRIQ